MGKVICIMGRSGYLSDLECGINVIELMYEVISYLIVMCNELKIKFCNDFFKVFYLIMNFGNIYGGDVINCICVCCEL